VLAAPCASAPQARNRAHHAEVTLRVNYVPLMVGEKWPAAGLCISSELAFDEPLLQTLDTGWEHRGDKMVLFRNVKYVHVRVYFLSLFIIINRIL
jgi:hypothetical protein